VKFLLDAHLPQALCRLFLAHGHEAVHTAELPGRNATKDRVNNRVSLDEQAGGHLEGQRLFHAHILQGRPWKLVLVETGNILTRDQVALYDRHLAGVVTALQSYKLIEIGRSAVTPIHP
jgi:predicted nuclease of predicted toxin-antitoxin system